jgi:hypothetical protein
MSSSSISNWSWKDRFYAFLLRRALGPILTPQSAIDLHRSIDAIDWSTGKLSLVDVRLDPAFLTSAIHQKRRVTGSDGGGNSDKDGGAFSPDAAQTIAVYEAYIGRCTLHLSLYNNIDQRRNGVASSAARKATSLLLQSVFGTNNNDAANDGESIPITALKVHIEIEGLHIVLAPGKNPESHCETECLHLTYPSSDEDQEASTAPGFFSKLVNSAMKSLRLSIDISDVNIRLYSQHCKNTPGSIEATLEGDGISENERASWVGLRVASAKYYDMIERNRNRGETLDFGLVGDSPGLVSNLPNNNTTVNEDDDCNTKEILVISKALDWEGIDVDSGETVFGVAVNVHPSNLNVPVLQSCNGELRFRVFEKWSRSTSMEKSSFLSARQDIDVSLCQRMSVEFNLSTMARFIAIAQATTTPIEDDVKFVDACDENYSALTQRNDSTPESDVSKIHILSDEFSKVAYDKIMKQYVEERHLARTNELRGGLLVPSFDDNNQSRLIDQEGISFDAFFDANDHSFSYYSASVDDKISNLGEEDCRESDCRMMSRIKFSLAECTVKAFIGSPPPKDTSYIILGDQPCQSDFILFSVGDIEVVAISSKTGSKLNCCVSHVDIECEMKYGETSINEHILRFLDEVGGESGGEFLVPSPPCISLLASISDAEPKIQDKSVQIDVSLRPFEVICHERAFRSIQNYASLFYLLNSALPDSRDNNSYDVRLSASCDSIVLLLPCEKDPSASLIAVNSSPIFGRHGYIDQGSGGRKALSIGIELDKITADLIRELSLGDNDAPSSLEHFMASFACNHMLLFATGSEIERGRKNRKFASFVPYRADLMALTGDEENGSAILLSYSTQMANPGNAFPIVLPLSSTKARELDASDDDEIGNAYDTNFSTNDTSGIQALDPQFVMSSEAKEAESELILSIPHVFLDCTTFEREHLSKIIFHYFEDFKSESRVSYAMSMSGDAHLKKSNLLGLAINVDQISLVLHGPQIADSNSYSLIIDKIKVHSLIGHRVRNIRCLSHDVTLYELNNFTSTHHAQTGSKSPMSCYERCKRIRGRLVTSPSSTARAIFFRQKFNEPLSPETPSILIDLLFRGDDECDEMSFHVAMYDMTYRYIMNSQWVENLSKLFGLTSKSDSSPAASPSIFHLFLSLTDCNIDYMSSGDLSTPSRLILRMGEIRFSSSFVSPSVIQSHKVSASDLRMYLCNHRRSYNEENSRLSCAQRYIQNADIYVPNNEKYLAGNSIGLDDRLCRMGFVNIAAIDSLDATISNNCVDRNCRLNNDPAHTLSLTMGKLTFYACKDSFSCLISTYNEWFIKASAISDEELEKLKKTSATRPQTEQVENKCLLPTQQQPSVTENDGSGRERTSLSAVGIRSQDTLFPERTSTSLIGHYDNRDDIVSLDLTKSLLFQNYYTFDATANQQSRNQPQRSTSEPLPGTNRMKEKSTTENEWATVEHAFIQYSNIPRDRDFTAEWVMQDKETKDKGNRWDATTSINSESVSQIVKVYPQHIPVDPISDPFSDGQLADSVKLASTDVAPPVKMRVVIKDATISFQFFDGFDWINDITGQVVRPKERREELLDCLVDGNDLPGSSSVLNDVVPLPEERNAWVQREIARRNLRRNGNKYFQIYMSGLKVKHDSYSEECQEQLPSSPQLASSLVFSATDFFISESISTRHPLKMIREWVNESDHPRDSNEGMIMLKMRTKHPSVRLSSDGKLMSDESRASLELLPLRCCLNQNALRFIRNFFASGSSSSPNDGEGLEMDDGVSDDGIMDIFFEAFNVKSCKLKVDYQPERMDIHSFREGNFIELLNICPLEDMILSLKPVAMSNLTGWSSVMNEISGRWLEDICSTQAHKFVTRASPFQPFANLSDPLADLAMVLIVPEGSLSDYFRGVIGGTTVFAGQVLLEALSTSAKLTRFAANQLNRQAVSVPSQGSKDSSSSSSMVPPCRPRHIPRNALDTTSHAYDSIAHGLSTANYKIVTVPLREYQIHGAAGAARSALRGIPVGVLCPIAGASEALSYTLLGLRNQLRPDIWKEEEASLRGLDYD